MNDKPCNMCRNYDPIKLGAGKKTADHGWCAVQSEYPARETPGQAFPPGVRRVKEGELAKPHIVLGRGTVSHCALYRAKP